MKLNLGMILETLDPDTIVSVVGNEDSPMTISWVFPLISGVTVQNDAVYVASWEQLLGIYADFPQFIVCIGGADEAVAFFQENGISGIIYSEGADLLTVYSEIQEVFLRYDKLERELLDAMLVDSSTQTILNCCAKFFEGHVMIFSTISTGFLLLEHSNNFMPPESNMFWKDVLEGSQAVLGRNQREKIKQLPNHPDKYPKATFHGATERYDERFITAFDYCNLRFATLIVMGVKRALTSKHHWLVDYVSNIIHPVIIKRYNSSLNVRNNARAAFSAALQLAKQNGESALMNVKSNLSQLRWKENDDYRIVLISLPRECRNISHYLYNYEYVFADSYYDSIALYYEDLVFILLHSDACSINSGQLKMLEHQLELDNGKCSIGSVYCDFVFTASQLNLAILALQHGVDKKRIHYCSDIMANHFVKALNSVIPIRAVCNSAIVRLHEHDLANDTEHMTTLEAYLMCNNSPLKTAEKLHIHKNTMTYRLKSIEKIISLDLNDPDERLSLLLSCIALRILNQ